MVSSVDSGEGCFHYMAGVGVYADCVPPPGLSTMEIPATTYAVFRITLNGTALHPQLKPAMATIWGLLIPASGLKVLDGPDLERYDGRFDTGSRGRAPDFHVPVESRPLLDTNGLPANRSSRTRSDRPICLARMGRGSSEGSLPCNWHIEVAASARHIEVAGKQKQSKHRSRHTANALQGARDATTP